jgi:HK97 family phage major capsid protein
MNEQELKALTGQINEELKKLSGINVELKKEIDKKAPIERIEDLINKAAGMELNVTKLSAQFDALELKLKDKKFGGPVSLFGDFEKAYKEKGKAALLNGKSIIPGGSFTFEMKDVNPLLYMKASTIDEATELSNSALANAVIVPMRTPGVEKLPDRQIMMLDAVNRGVTNSNRVTWVERSARTEGTNQVAEGNQYAQSDMTYIQKSAEVEKCGTFLKVTNEALEDWDELLTQIKNELFPSVERKMESQLYGGSGVSPQVDGIKTTASAYASTSLNGEIESPNNMDAIIAASNQIDEYNYLANYAFMAPADYRKMLLAKDKNGNYVVPPFADASRMSIDGVRPVKSNLITAGDILVGDFSKITLYTRRGIEIKIWDQDSTDPEYDLKTITASVRYAVKFPAPHIYAFVYDTLSDIQSAIQKIAG